MCEAVQKGNTKLCSHIMHIPYIREHGKSKFTLKYV